MEIGRSISQLGALLTTSFICYKSLDFFMNADDLDRKVCFAFFCVTSLHSLRYIVGKIV